MIKKGDLFTGVPMGGRRPGLWHVERVTRTTIDPQIDGKSVSPNGWSESDPRWNQIKFVKVPLRPILVEACRYKSEGPDRILIYGPSHIFLAEPEADAPHKCQKIERR